jgi:cyanophycinase
MRCTSWFPLMLLLPGCPDPGDSAVESGEPLDSPVEDSGAPDSGDTGEGPTPGPGVVVLAGGGSEGELGDEQAWSARLYGALLTGGDVTGDGLVRVAILSAAEESDWLPGYFEWLGADEAFNLQLATAEAADSCRTAALLQAVDAIFVKGGDQGEYYDLWNNTATERVILSLAQYHGGGVGGTSAGAMSMAGYALAGGMDLVSRDVLEDACTPWLDDASDGGSGIHDDFLGIVPEVIIDTHFTQRGRLGRLAGALARALDEGAPSTLLGIGIEQQTGLILVDGLAEVVGTGAVSFVQATDESSMIRDCGEPLVFTDLRLDRLTEGWVFGLDERAPLEPPGDAEALAWAGPEGENAGEWYAYGDVPEHEERFAWVVERDLAPWGLHGGSDAPLLLEAVGVLDAHHSDGRAAAHEALFRALYEQPGATGFLVAWGSLLERPSPAPDRVRFADNDYVESEPQASTIVVASHTADWRALAPVPSLYDAGDGGLHAAGLSGLRLHLLADSGRTGLAYDARERVVTTP